MLFLIIWCQECFPSVFSQMYLKIWAVFFLYKEEIVVKFTVPLVLTQFYDFISIIFLILKKLWTSQLVE